MSAGIGNGTVRRFSWQDEGKNISQIANELTFCGLTLNQARIYIFLLARGTSPVRVISKGLGLHRADVYRKLRELESLGLLEEYIDSPKRYAAIDPMDAAPVLLRKQEEKLASYKRTLDDSFMKLNILRKLPPNPRGSHNGPESEESSYRLVAGRKRYYNEMRSMIRGAKDEILRIVSAGGLIRTFLAGLDEEYAFARSKGVSIRMISEVNSKNRSYARRMSNIVQLRHLNGVHLRFTVVDKSASVLGARFDEASRSLNSDEDRYIVFRDPMLAEGFQFFFEHLWTDAKALRL